MEWQVATDGWGPQATKCIMGWPDAALGDQTLEGESRLAARSAWRPRPSMSIPYPQEIGGEQPQRRGVRTQLIHRPLGRVAGVLCNLCVLVAGHGGDVRLREPFSPSSRQEGRRRDVPAAPVLSVRPAPGNRGMGNVFSLLGPGSSADGLNEVNSDVVPLLRRL